MTQIIANSLQVYNGMVTCYPQFSKESILEISENFKHEKCYASNGGVICYVVDGKVFVTPQTRRALMALVNAGFRNDRFGVPFSIGDYPKHEEAQWKALMAQAKKEWAKEFEADCVTYCDEHHIGALSAETLKKCFQMPVTGVQVKHLYFETVYYPVINGTCLDCFGADVIGTYSSNGGKVVFVYRDGKTYVAKSYDILPKLRAAGYKEGSLAVPFSIGEEIVDPGLRARWEAISED